MVYSELCRQCKQPWTFHDEDRQEPLLCDTCQGEWNKHLLIQDIMSGALVTPFLERIMEEDANE